MIFKFLVSWDHKNLDALLLLLVLQGRLWQGVKAFSTPSPSLSGGWDRFKAVCPADPECIARFDPSLVVEEDEATWVAVYRANNNLPSVLRQDLFASMTLATTAAPSSSQVPSPLQTKSGVELSLSKPVAIARLRPSDLFDSQWTLDKLQCTLKKEDMDKDCEGGSEHVEALSVCVDALLLNHLRQQQKIEEELDSTYSPWFHKVIRCKATLVSASVLESRGFVEVEELSKDMATHVSCLEGALERYAQKASQVHVSSNAGAGEKDGNSWGGVGSLAVERTLEMVGLLGQLQQDLEKVQDEDGSEEEGEEFDPWAGVRRYL